MKTLLIKAKAIPGKTTYRIPARHPFDCDKDGNLSPSPLTPGIQLAIGKETEVPAFDARHEQLLRGDEHLEVVDSEGKHDEPEVDHLELALKKLPPAVKLQLEAGLRQAEEAMRGELEDLSKANAELRNELAEQDEQLSDQSKAIAELEAKLKAATAVPPVDTKPPEVKPAEAKTEKVEKKK